MVKMMLLCCSGLLLLLAAGAAAAPPAWACGTQRDYYSKITTVCAPAEANAAQRNLGGELLVLDTKSYGSKACQGCNPDIPATCFETCRDTNGCNAWVVCTNRDGCGSGCQAYAKQFKQPVAYSDKLPHKFWGNWGGCDGDKWPFGMCSLKVVADPKNPPVTSSKPSDGWVSGIITRSPGDSRCPASLSAKSCKACPASKDPSKCFSCIAATNTLDATDKCVTCASLTSTSSQDTCVRCVSGSNAAVCGACLDADCQDTDCMNAQRADRSKAPNLAAVDQCFKCQQDADKAKPGVSTESGSKAASCAKCFEVSSVPKANREACIAGITAPGGSAASAAGAAACLDTYVTDRTKCQSCAAKAKTTTEANACGACTNGGNVPASYTDACVSCVLTSADDGAKSYCANLDRETNQAAVAAFYKCLSAAKGPDAPANCWQCYRSGSNESAQKCYACMGKVSGANGIHCSHCWVPSRMASKVSDTCEACVVAKDKAKGSGSECWS